MFALKVIMVVVPLWIFAVTSAECPTRCHCSKYKMFCTEARLYSLPKQVYNTTELVRVELDRIPQINTTTGLQDVTRLELVSVQLQKIQPGAFCNMTKLEYLEITWNNITVLGANTFKCLQHVYLLNLTRNKIRSLERSTFAGLDNIRILDLTDNIIRQLQANVFEGMKYVNNCNITLPRRHVEQYRVLRVDTQVSKYLCTFTRLSLAVDPSRRIPMHLNPGVYIGFSTFIYENINRIFSGLLYLDMRDGHSSNLEVGYLQNLTHLRYFDFSYNTITELHDGFGEFTSLRMLNFSHNWISRLACRCFHSLKSLETVDLSHNRISEITSDVFVGLSKLRTLDLSDNKILRLGNNTFSTLGMLRELYLHDNYIQHIDITAFSHLTLKRLSLAFNASPLNLYETIFRDLQILHFLRFYRLSLPQDVQILEALQLQPAEASSDSSTRELSDALLAVPYVRNLDLTLYHFIFPESLNTSTIYELEIYSRDFKFIKTFPKLKFLIAHNIEHTSIGEAAFLEMKSLIELRLYYKTNLTIKKGSFHGLNNLELLFIQVDGIPKDGDILLGPLDAGVFQGLYNLTKLDFRHNRLVYLNPATFQDLKKIEVIILSNNNINKIDAGVFGALCEDDFELSCINVTLPQYCNSTNALTTLKHLYLSFNNITHIHPHAFISCNNLHTLDLSFNKFLKLDSRFLYTPGLKVLDMTFCDITNIPNNTFECSPLLSNIIFPYNNMNKLTVDTLFTTRNLQSIDLRLSLISCDCDLYQTWLWLRQQHVRYQTAMFHENSTCVGENIDKAMTNIKCNTEREISASKNMKTTKGDYAFFKQYVEPTVLIVIFISGLVCNGFLLFVSLWHSDMRTQHNTCVIHLATVDLLSLVLNLPLSYWDVVNVTWEFDNTLCKVFLFSKDVMVGVTVLSVVALSVERFLVARNFKDLKKMCSKSEKPPIVWLLMMTWISAIVTSLPAYFFSAIVDSRCLYCPPGNKDYIRNVWTFQLVMYCLAPAVVIMYLNIKTSQFLRESISKIPGELKHNVKARNRKTAANTVLVLALLFVISNFPSYILRVLVAWSVVDMEDMFLVSFFTFCLFFFNTVFNPISLFIMSSKYKSYALRYISFLGNEQDS